MTATPSNPVQSCQPITDTLCMLGNLPLQYADGPDYCTVKDVTGGAFALTVQPDLMKLLEAHASAHATLTARVEELEANERAYESIVGPMTYQEVSDQFADYAIRIEELETAFRFIADGYDNHDVNHLDYRVKVYQVALDVLQPKGAV